MTKVSVVFEYEEPEYCRLCLSKETEGNDLTMIQSDTIGIIQELLQIQLDKTDSESFICSTCVESLEEFYSYRTRCQRNNVALQKKAEERKQQQIELAKSAIANANVLDQVKDGEPIRVVIRMNAEGKASVRLQVQSKPKVKEQNKEDSVPEAVSINEEPGTSSSTASTSKATPNIPAAVVDKKPATTEKTSTAAPKKLIRLPMQPFYFYKTYGKFVDTYGLIYGGYRYCASVPRKQHIYWMCEQRKTHRCQAVFLVNKSYTEFMLSCGHSHDPPQVKRGQKIFKSADVLPDVMKSAHMREERLKAEGINSVHQRKTYIKLLSKQEEEDYTSEEDSEDEEEYSGDDSSQMELDNEEEVKQEKSGNKEQEKEKTAPVAVKKEQVHDDGDDCTYIIAELT